MSRHEGIMGLIVQTATAQRDARSSVNSTAVRSTYVASERSRTVRREAFRTASGEYLEALKAYAEPRGTTKILELLALRGTFIDKMLALREAEPGGEGMAQVQAMLGTLDRAREELSRAAAALSEAQSRVARRRPGADPEAVTARTALYEAATLALSVLTQELEHALQQANEEMLN